MNHVAYLYSFANEKETYRPVEYVIVDLAVSTVDSIKYAANEMMGKSPVVEHVYLVPPRPTIATDFHNTMKHPTIDNCIAFKDYIERIGIRII